MIPLPVILIAQTECWDGCEADSGGTEDAQSTFGIGRIIILKVGKNPGFLNQAYQGGEIYFLIGFFPSDFSEFLIL